MSFLHPEFLYYMLPPLFILFGLLLTQKESQEHFFSQEVIDKLRVSANTLTLKARNALMFLVGFLMIVALAQPVINEGTITIKAKSADIMIALDISDSMLGEDVYPNRLKLAKQKALDLLRMAPNERVGVIAFAKNSYLVSPLSFDHSAVEFLLSQLDTDSITEKGTNFLSMLDVVNKSLNKEGKKYLLILSDGGDKSDFSKEIEIAKEHDIVVFVLGLGTLKGAPIKLANGSFIKEKGNIIISKLNENISELATATGGVYIENSTSNEDIKTMLQEIESIADKKELKSEEIPRYIPLFYFPLGLALFILLIATSSMSKREVVNLPSIFILFVLLFTTADVKAGVFDFMELQEAKEAYDAQDYAKAATLYKNYAEKTNNGESYYNAGNAFYKQEDYTKAIESYEKATFENKDLRAKNFSNMGNSYAKQGDVENLQKAVEIYEKSLKIKEDEQTRENLEAVKKLLKEQEQDSKDDEQNDEKDKKQDKDKNKDKNKENDDNKESKDGDKSENKDESSSEDSQDKEKSDEKKENSQKEDKGQKSDEDNKKEDSDKSQENNETKDEQKSKPELDELDKEEDNKTSSSSAPQNTQPMEMSDAEEQKWLGELNKQHSTYIYMLNDSKPKEDDTNDKPW